jgi:hypothetical protein
MRISSDLSEKSTFICEFWYFIKISLFDGKKEASKQAPPVKTITKTLPHTKTLPLDNFSIL